MGTDCGPDGLFGILLKNYADDLGTMLTKFERDVHNILEDEFGRCVDHSNRVYLDAVDETINQKWGPLFIEKFFQMGIEVPNKAWLLYTDTTDIRPARCTTDGEQWGLGFSLFTRPWEYPTMKESFRKVAAWHTWVWMS